MQHPFQSFRAARWLRSTNLLLQAILFAALFAGLNYLARNNSWRFDLTQLRRHSLSAETRAYLANLGRGQLPGSIKIRVTNTFPRDPATAGPDAPPDLAQINTDLAALLREYTYALETNPAVSLSIENIDIFQRPRETLQPNRLTLASGGQTRELTLDDLYQTQYDPAAKTTRRTAFIGEQALTAAILGVTNPDKKTIYFLTGHGEMDINGTDSARGLSELLVALRQRDYAVGVLDLTRARAIPDDADLLIIIGAQNRCEPYEQELLRNYMTTRAGRIILCATPGIAPTGLEDLLGEWGILVDDTWASTYPPTNDGLVLSTYNPHPITKTLIDNQLRLLLGAARSARPDPTRATDPGLTVTPLVLTGADIFGKRNYLLRRTPKFDPALDLPGPLPIVTVSERVAAKNNLTFSVPVGRLIAIGSSDFVANGRLNAGANKTLFFSAIDWLVERDANLNIPARPIEKYQLTLTRDQLARLRAMLLFGAPAAFALLGLIVYWTRRK